MSSQKADLRYNLSLRTFSTSSVYSKTTSYNIFTLTDKKIQADAFTQRCITRTQRPITNIMTCRFTPTQPYPNTLSLSLSDVVCYFHRPPLDRPWHMFYKQSVDRHIPSRHKLVMTQLITAHPRRPSEHLAGRAKTTQVTANRGQITCTTVTSTLIDLRYYPTLTDYLKMAELSYGIFV